MIFYKCLGTYYPTIILSLDWCTNIKLLFPNNDVFICLAIYIIIVAKYNDI